MRLEYCPMCRIVTMEIVDTDQNAMPLPPDTDRVPLAAQFLTYKCPECGHEERRPASPATDGRVRPSGKRNAAGFSGYDKLMGWIFALDAVVCVVELAMLASDSARDSGLIAMWLVAALVFGMAAQREFAHRFQ